MRTRILLSICLPWLALGSCWAFCQRTYAQTPSPTATPLSASVAQFFKAHCIDCHGSSEPEAGLSLDAISWDEANSTALALEKSLRKIRGRQMPPLDYEVLESEEHEQIVQELERLLDKRAREHPFVGKIESFRRLTRTEYANTIRDLLALEIDPQKWLPKDEASYGFDNILVADLSPTLMDRYLSAAEAISRSAVGNTGLSVGGETFRVPPDLTQEDRLPGFPLGTRGGTKLIYQFPRDGTYEIQLRLARDRNEHVEGMTRRHEIHVLIDRKLCKTFEVRPARDGDHSKIDAHLSARLSVEAGAHEVIATFVKDSDSLIETMRQPLESHFNVHRHPRQTPALYEISIVGPFASTGPGQTASRERIFTVTPQNESEEEVCAKQIVGDLARRAFRRPVSPEDIERPLSFYHRARERGEGFEEGIERALASILISPKFLFRVEALDIPSASETPYRISPVELASRVSFFLWSSMPDEELLSLAENKQLQQPEVLHAQVERMLKDPRADNLVTNFAAQWLYLRNLDSASPDARLYPDFDDNLRQAMRMETESLFREILRNDSSVLQLLRSDHTYLNERLAKHYGIPNVYGTRFRRVELEPGGVRGGLLRHASILTVTSYATRTSPVLRGNWVLKNLVDNPPPPPPANVPALEDNSVSADLPIRERLAAHRNNAACAGCHQLIDPVGFALENYDAIGRWREREAGQRIDATGSLPGGKEFMGVEGLEAALLDHPEWFVSGLTRKLMTFALGRGTEALDGPTIRQIVRDSQSQEYRFSSVIMGIIDSPAFQLRSSL